MVNNFILIFVNFNVANLTVIPSWENVTGDHISEYLREVKAFTLVEEVTVTFTKWDLVRNEAVRDNGGEFVHISCNVEVLYRSKSENFELGNVVEDSFRTSYSNSLYISRLKSKLSQFVDDSIRLVATELSKDSNKPPIDDEEGDDVNDNYSIDLIKDDRSKSHTHEKEETAVVVLICSVVIAVSSVVFSVLYMLKRNNKDEERDSINSLEHFSMNNRKDMPLQEVIQ